jgi:glutaredoxin
MLKAIVWTRDRCDYCDMAKKELKLRGYEIEERNIWGDWHKNDLLEVAPEAKTVPQIFIRNKHIGGYNDLMQYFEETTSNYGH